MSLKISNNIVGDGQPIFFIHGVGSRKYSWNQVIEELKNNYKCITYDLRGHGDTPLPNGNDFILDDLVDDLENLRLNLKLEKIHIVGHSLGGQIGPAYARKFPDYVKSLTLLSTAAFRTDAEKQKILDLINNIKTLGINEVVTKLITRWYTDSFINSNPKIVDERILMLKEMNIDTLCRVFWIYATCTMENWIHEINLPSLVMTGENDFSCNPRLNKLITEAMPNARLEILKDLRHSITTEKPNLVGKKINIFLKSI